MHKDKKNFLNKNMAFSNKNMQNPWYYEMKEFSYNFRLTDIQSALGISQLRKINEFTKKRQQIAKIYDSEFKKN